MTGTKYRKFTFGIVAFLMLLIGLVITGLYPEIVTSNYSTFAFAISAIFTGFIGGNMTEWKFLTQSRQSEKTKEDIK